jgi:hypothetical protein
MGIANSSKLRGVVLSVLITTLTPLTSSARQIMFSSSVTAQQGAIITKDLGTDLSLPADATTQKVMGINDLSDQSLKQWLIDRVGFVIGETENDKDKLVQGAQLNYPNAGIFPAFETPNRNTARPENAGERNGATKRVSTVMANVGTSYYYMGKDKGFVVEYKFTARSGQQGLIPVTSPRVGIIKVGSGLFGDVPYRQNPASIANTWFRISTLFHEAHHSDGNGTSLGMPHAVCPSGIYANYNACDREGNGPYAVGAYLVKMARTKCMADGSCNAGEAEVMANMAADFHSRLLADNFIDPRPEGVVSGVTPAN